MIMDISLIPDSAPFNAEQRAWLNGFLAGWLGLQGSTASTAVDEAPPPATPAGPEAEAAVTGRVGGKRKLERAGLGEGDAPGRDRPGRGPVVRGRRLAGPLSRELRRAGGGADRPPRRPGRRAGRHPRRRGDHAPRRTG